MSEIDNEANKKADSASGVGVQRIVRRLVGDAGNHGWEPHKPMTWTARFATLRKPVTMRRYMGYWNDDGPVMKDTLCKAGERVKIVMVSRFGDVGITANLSAENGYGARLMLDDLCDFSLDA